MMPLGKVSPTSGALNGPTSGVTGSERDRLRAAGQQFEAMLLEMLLHEARQAAAGDTSGFAPGVFQEWQDQQLAERMSAAGGIGLSDLILRQLAPEGAPRRP